MPVSGQDGKIVLDYGCGPGNDLVGFSIYSNPTKLIGVDVSPKALGLAKERLDLHNRSAEFILINELDNRIPLPSKSVDYIHTSGVLHHCANLELVLAELHRVLKDDGFMSVMVYNYSSIYVHFYIAYMLKLKSRKNSEMNLQDVFRMSTDGEYVPISKYYKPMVDKNTSFYYISI